MIKKLFITALLFSTGYVTSQEFNWQWAKRGGGVRMAPNEFSNGFSEHYEHIKDIAIDEDNNYYFLAQVTVSNVNYDGVPISVYNHDGSESGYSDVLLLSTTCDGSYRWSRVIGGGHTDTGYSISVDDNGGVYVSLSVFSDLNQGPISFIPPHFSEEDILPAIPENVNALENHPAHKRIAIAKYSQEDGSLTWKKLLQGDVNFLTAQSTISALYVEGDSTIHALVGLLKGTHMDGNAIVPDEYDIVPGQAVQYLKYFIVRLNANGGYESVLPVSIDGLVKEELFKFRYDPQLDRYYVGGSRNEAGYFNGQPLEWMLNFGYNGSDFNQQMVFLALSGEGEELWRKEFVATPHYTGSEVMRDIQIDDESNIYICGRYLNYADKNTPIVDYTWGNYPIPSLSGWGYKKFIMKMNSDGNVLWYQSNTGYTSQEAQTGLPEARSVGIGDNEILLGAEAEDEVWGDFEMIRPVNYLTDPLIVKLDKETGEVIGTHDIWGTINYRGDNITAMKKDNDGNYVVGGFFSAELFTAEDDGIETITTASGFSGYTDFYIAKLGATQCGVPVASVKDFNGDQLKVYPNPASDILNIKSQLSLESYTIINVMGQVLMSGSLEGSATINVGSLVNGTYIVKITDIKGNSVSKKIMKQ